MLPFKLFLSSVCPVMKTDSEADEPCVLLAHLSSHHLLGSHGTHRVLGDAWGTGEDISYTLSISSSVERFRLNGY